MSRRTPRCRHARRPERRKPIWRCLGAFPALHSGAPMTHKMVRCQTCRDVGKHSASSWTRSRTSERNAEGACKRFSERARHLRGPRDPIRLWQRARRQCAVAQSFARYRFCSLQSVYTYVLMLFLHCCLVCIMTVQLILYSYICVCRNDTLLYYTLDYLLCASPSPAAFRRSRCVRSSHRIGACNCL